MNISARATALAATLTEMERQGEHRFNPARFQFIRALLDKSGQQTDSVQALVLSKAEQALADYQMLLNESKQQTQQLAEALSQDSVPQEIEALIQSNRFDEANRYLARIQRKSNPQAYLALRSLFQVEEDEEPEVQQLSFDEMLMEQESQVLKSFSASANEEIHSQDGQFADLKSHRLFKDTWVKLQAEKIVSDAINQAPKDAGPLNSHLLAIRSIEAVKKLSPEYLNRFVSYMDSLLWLEQAVKQLEVNEQKSKRKSRSKSKADSTGS